MIIILTLKIHKRKHDYLHKNMKTKKKREKACKHPLFNFYRGGLKISPRFPDQKTVCMPSSNLRFTGSQKEQSRVKFNFDKVFDMDSEQ